MRKAEGEERDTLRKRLKEASKQISHRVALAKSNWSTKKAEFIHSIYHSPSQSWKAIKELIAGNSCYHNKPVAMKMKIKSGELASNDKQNLEDVKEHLHGVYNAKRERFAEAAKLIKQRGHQITMKEFVRAIKKLKMGKRQA